jgi:hypothetical protein
MTIVLARRIGIDLSRNTLVIEWHGQGPSEEGRVSATIDIGSRGALLGIDLETCWIQITDAPAGPSAPIRSTTVSVVLEANRLILPRTGDGYTIAWPSGNQCWRQRIGNHTVETCAVTIGR